MGSRFLKKFLAAFLLILSGCWNQPHGFVSKEPVIIQTQFSRLPVWHPDYKTAKAVEIYSGEPDQNELNDVQCPIPMDCRVKNYTGVQCVFASIECLARWAECDLLLKPEPITSRPGCRSFSNPSDAGSKLQRFGVRYEQEYRNEKAAIDLIKKAMSEGRGCLFGVPGHAMVLCHYDEEKNIVKYINNSDSSLRIHTWTVNEFKRRWDGWVLVIYAKPDVIPQKLGRLLGPNSIPIIDRNGSQGQYPRDYIPIPSKD